MRDADRPCLPHELWGRRFRIGLWSRTTPRAAWAAVVDLAGQPLRHAPEPAVPPAAALGHDTGGDEFIPARPPPPCGRAGMGFGQDLRREAADRIGDA